MSCILALLLCIHTLRITVSAIVSVLTQNSFSSGNLLCSEICFVWYEYTDYFLLWDIFFYHFPFNIPKGLNLKSISHQQQRLVLGLTTHSDNGCILTDVQEDLHLMQLLIYLGLNWAFYVMFNYTYFSSSFANSCCLLNCFWTFLAFYFAYPLNFIKTNKIFEWFL